MPESKLKKNMRQKASKPNSGTGFGTTNRLYSTSFMNSPLYPTRSALDFQAEEKPKEKPKEKSKETTPEQRLDDKDQLSLMLQKWKAEEPKWVEGSPGKFFGTDLDKLKAQLADQEKSTWEKEVKATRDWAKENKDKLDRRELAETLVQAFTQLAAGWYGLKHGMDMSGLEFNKQDWKAKLADLRQQEASKLSEADKREAMRERTRAKLERLKGLITGAEYQEDKDKRRAEYMKERNKWLNALKEQFEGGALKASDMRQLKQAEEAKLNELQRAAELYENGEEEKALLLLKKRYADSKDPVTKEALSELDDFWMDKSEVEAFFDKERKLIRAKMNGFERLEKQSAGLPSTIKVRSSRGKIVEIREDMLDAARKKDPGLKVIE